jgi:hypothetical protein
MTQRTARLVTRLSLSLAAAAALAACEPAEDNNATNNQPGDMALPDMDVDQAPDMDPDMVAAQATLKAASMAVSRLVDVAAPAPITLDLTFEGELPDGAMVEVVFGLPNIHRITVPAAAQLTVRAAARAPTPCAACEPASACARSRRRRAAWCRAARTSWSWRLTGRRWRSARSACRGVRRLTARRRSPSATQARTAR